MSIAMKRILAQVVLAATVALLLLVLTGGVQGQPPGVVMGGYRDHASRTPAP